MSRSLRVLLGGHRITGCIIAVFFLMWFVTGLILIYHPYPRLSDKELYEKEEALPDFLPDIRSIEERAGDRLTALSIRRFQGQTLISVSTAKSSFVYCADGTDSIKPLDFFAVKNLVKRWIDAPVIRVDTLHKRAQWVLYSRYDQVMPIYKFYFDDPERHELFISGKTGEVQQVTSRCQRFWAWIGAIPHKFYIPWLRINLELWQGSITVAAIFCVLASLTGLLVGLWLFYKRYKRTGVWESPYRKPWFRLHHVLGGVFGIFVLAWGVSGVFSMQRIPQWLINTDGNYIFNPNRMWEKNLLPIGSYRLDYNRLKETYPDLKRVRWTRFRDIPAYEVVVGDREFMIDASSSEIRELFIPECTVIDGIKSVHGEDVSFKISLLDHYDDYYLSRSMNLPLPVYKVTVDDSIHSRYYVSPETGYIRYLNKNKMVKKWLFNGIHYLHIHWLVERPVLWTICIWILCLGGGFVCLTGCWIGVKYLSRKFRSGSWVRSR